jgi:hypothetical protein
VLKVVLLLKRRPGLSRAEFFEHYEHVHAPLAAQLSMNALHYERHYLHPAPAFGGGAPAEPEYDVITELRYDDMDAYLADQAQARDRPELVAAILADERELFDRSKTRIAFVESRVSSD